MNCPRCGKPVADDNIICDSCGMIFNNSSNTSSNTNANSNTNYNFNNSNININKKDNNTGNNFNQSQSQSQNKSYNNNYSSYAEQVTFQQLLSENGITEDEVSAFIGPKNRAYYLDAFNRISTNRNYNFIDYSNSRARNFNLGKILNVWWLLYRKMFQECAYGFIIGIAASIIRGIFGNFFLIGWVITLATRLIWLVLIILVVAYGDQLYRDFVIKRVKEIKQMYGNSPNYYDILTSSGGTLF